ncbi:MAG: tryptophan-rich sensory protein [Flavipsychrobacter sp.]|nr:tryptophan-rich sensory protein [Flavipsychrobacter sp.]
MSTTMVKDVVIHAPQSKKKYPWWQGAIALIIVSVVGALSAGTKKRSKEIYEVKEKQAPWAPPRWLFGPAWTFNNAFLIWGLLQILNDEQMKDRNKLLILQALIWADFFSFGYVYFKKGSPVLAEVWTQADATFATASFFTALKADKKLAWAYLPLLVWTWYASSLSGYQALKNPDPFLGTPAVLN